MEVRRQLQKVVWGTGNKDQGQRMTRQPLKFSGKHVAEDNQTSQWEGQKSILKPEVYAMSSQHTQERQSWLLTLVGAGSI